MSTSFFSQTFRHNGSAVFGTMPPMCRSCPDVNKLRGMDTTILGQHRPFMSIKIVCTTQRVTRRVSLCSLIRLIGVCADRDQPEFLCSRSDSRYLEVHVATAGGWLTRYRPREVRNSIYRYRKIHIDYRLKFLYRFISPISIIYGNTMSNEYTKFYSSVIKVAEVYIWDSHMMDRWWKMTAFHTMTTAPIKSMMTPSNGNIFRVTGLLYGEFTGHGWIPQTRPVMWSFDVFVDLCLE